MSDTHLIPDFGDHDDDFDDSHQDYLDAERDAEMLPDPTEPPEPEERIARHEDVSDGRFMCRCGWPGVGQAGTAETFAAHRHINPTDTPFGPPDRTPAVEHAAQAIVRWEDVLDWDGLSERLRDYPRGQARAALAAALDVEEMARAIQADQTRRHLWSSLRWEDLEERHRDAYRRDARAVRAAILGEEAKTDA